MMLASRSFSISSIIKRSNVIRSMSMNGKTTAEQYIKDNKIMVFSKSYCPYCTKAKEELTKLTTFKVIELDQMDEGDSIQKELLDRTGQRTVPNVFIGGKHIGGCDKTVAMIASGELQKLL